MTQMGFLDLSDRYASLDAKRDPLVGIDAAVPWEEFRPALERVWRKPDAERKSRAGRKPMDAVVRPTHSDRWRSGPHCSRRWC